MKSEPVSWLLLERYALGELGPDERADVEARLAASEEDRACLAQIRADTSALPLLPLTAPARLRVAPAGPGSVPRSPAAQSARARWIATSGALCAAAAALLLVLRPKPPSTAPTPDAQPRVPAVNAVGIA